MGARPQHQPPQSAVCVLRTEPQGPCKHPAFPCPSWWAEPGASVLLRTAELFLHKVLFMVALGLMGTQMSGSLRSQEESWLAWRLVLPWHCSFQEVRIQSPGPRQGNSSNWSVWGLGFPPRLAWMTKVWVTSVWPRALWVSAPSSQVSLGESRGSPSTEQGPQTPP